MESTVQYKCPNCGGELRFDPNTQGFACDWCNSLFAYGEIVEDVSEEFSADDVQQEYGGKHDYSDETDVYVCSSCGAEIICDRNTAATFCCYCHNPVSLSGRLSGEFRPETVIPFKIDREKALKIFTERFKKKWFVPRDFLSQSQLETMTGLYVPYWMADCGVQASISGVGKVQMPVVRHGGSAILVKVFSVSREGTMRFDKVPADASRRIDDELIDAIEPFSYSELTDFSMSYLSGFYADKYDVNTDELLPRIKNRLIPASEQMLRKDITGYTTVDIKQRSVRILDINWHYALLPVWFMNYNHRGKTYSYAINGQTGKISGKYPISPLKTAIGALIAAVIAFLAVYIVGVSRL